MFDDSISLEVADQVILLMARLVLVVMALAWFDGVVGLLILLIAGLSAWPFQLRRTDKASGRPDSAR